MSGKKEETAGVPETIELSDITDRIRMEERETGGKDDTTATVEPETIELPPVVPSGNDGDADTPAKEPMAAKPRHGGRRTAVIAAVAAVALLVAGGIAWKTHADRLMAETRADCAAAGERLRAATNDYDTLLNGDAATAAKTDVKSVKDTKTLDALSKAMKTTTPTVVSCKADSRSGMQDATKRITANTAWYKAHRKSLSRLVEAVETSRLDKTVDDANALYEATDGKVQDDKTRATLLDAIKKRDADAIARAVKSVNESKAAKEKADAEAKAKAEQEAAAAAAAAAQQASQSYSSGSSSTRGGSSYSGGKSYSYSNRNNYSYSGGSSSSNGGGSSYTPSQSTNNGGNGGGSASSGDVHYSWEDNTGDQYDCQPGKFCPIG